MHVTLHLTERCNMACRYCYETPGARDMTFETARAAIANCATGPNCGVIFFGGEPLLKQELMWDVIRDCDARDPHRFHYKVTTNGLLLDEAFLENARRHRLHVAMSHDGVAASHDAHRVDAEGRGTFARLAEKLALLLRFQPYAPVMLTVNPDTAARLEKSVRWLQAAGVRYLIVSLNYGAAWTDADVSRLGREFRALERWHLANYRAGRKIYFSPFDKRIASHIFAGRSVSCQLGKRQISVGADGTLYPCVQFVGRREYAIGDAARGLDETKRDAIFCRNEAEKPTCADCALNGRCHNKCGCMNIQSTGALDKIPALLCEYERMMFPIADRLANTLYKERNALFLQRHYDPMFPVMSFLEDLSV